jgi:tetratricopeptide (TPR) repeat protein
MPGEQNPAATVHWPVLSGPVPPLAAFYSPRPETGFAATGGPSEPPARLIRAQEVGSYVLTGPGGTGKTQLAAAYARALWQSRDTELLVWITASSRAAILAGYAEAFARTSGAPGGPAAGGDSGRAAGEAGRPAAEAGRYGRGENQEELAHRFLRWLSESTRSWLVVLDDLTDAGDLTGLWPRGAMGRSVLTTRLPPASIAPPRLQAKLVQISPFSRREALAFLTTRLFEDTAQRNGALDLAEALGCLPIALSQAAALIADATIDCRQYHGQFDERWQAMGIGPDSGYAATVAVTWSLALDRSDQLLPSALARPLLAMLAMLDPNGVPAAVLTAPAARAYIGSYTADRADAADADVRRALSSLDQVGLISIDASNPVRTVYVHALVQACVRQVLPDAVRDSAAAAAANAVLQAWPQPCLDPLLDQALRDCTATLSQAAPQIAWTPDPGHRLLVRAGRSLDEARLSGPAVAYWRAMTQASAREGEAETVDGEAAQAIAAQASEYLTRLAAAYQAAGRVDLAIGVLTDALERHEEALGPGHPDTLTARAELARTCLAADRVDEAIPHFERTLAGREWVLGPDHPETLAARLDLAAAYRAAGRLDDAIKVFQRTLADQELVLGEDHATTIATRGSLAAALHSTGRTQDAIPLYVRTLADRERLLGPDHPDTLTARGNLAYAYRSVGKLKEAIPLYSRTLADRQRVQGPDHLDTINSRANLAAAYYSARKVKDALPLYEQALADRERVQGVDHPDTLTARGNLASAYHSAGRMVTALQLYERTLAGYERVLGPHHENTLTSRANLAIAYHEARRTPDAIALFQRTLSDCEQALPADHPLTQGVRESLEAARRT